MKAKTKFLKCYDGLPRQARAQLVYDAYGDKPMSLNVIASEVRGIPGKGEPTKLGKKTLERLGFKDDQDGPNVMHVGGV